MAREVIQKWYFGQPVLRTGGVGKAGWVKDTGNTLGLHQKSASGYLANLYGGDQTDGGNENNWAAIYIPVNELYPYALETGQWTYNMTGGEAYGVNMVIWMHDPNNPSKRVEITQSPSHADLAKAQGWNKHVLNTATTQFFYYGEPDPIGESTGLTKGVQYKWSEYQADVVFKRWTIYRISLEYGWYDTGTFDDAWVADVKFNGKVILLQPRDGEILGRETKSIYIATGSTSVTKVTAISPNATKRVRILSVFAASKNTTGALFEAYFHTGGDITTNSTKAIFMAWLDSDSPAPSAGASYGDNGPLGAIGEIVSIRTDTEIGTDGFFVIVYREE